VSQRLSQSSSTSWSRSAGVSFEMSKAGRVMGSVSSGCARAARRPRCLGSEHLGDEQRPDGPGKRFAPESPMTTNRTRSRRTVDNPPWGEKGCRRETVSPTRACRPSRQCASSRCTRSR
jgi:hypothetical protein